jgi:hypothetical protein
VGRDTGIDGGELDRAMIESLGRCMVVPVTGFQLSWQPGTHADTGVKTAVAKEGKLESSLTGGPVDFAESCRGARPLELRRVRARGATFPCPGFNSGAVHAKDV